MLILGFCLAEHNPLCISEKSGQQFNCPVDSWGISTFTGRIAYRSSDGDLGNSFLSFGLLKAPPEGKESKA